MEAIRDTHVLVAPHHGRESGFHSPLFRVIRPLVTIISDGRFVDTSATSLYSERTKGWQVNRRNGTSRFQEVRDHEERWGNRRDSDSTWLHRGQANFGCNYRLEQRRLQGGEV